jgi:hypothetical protein
MQRDTTFPTIHSDLDFSLIISLKYGYISSFLWFYLIKIKLCKLEILFMIKNKLLEWIIIGLLFVVIFIPSSRKEANPLANLLKPSSYVTLVIIVPETHADQIREAMGRAGAGKTEHYSYGSFSMKGVSRFKPDKGAKPFIGQEGILETVSEERIETICSVDILEEVIEEIKRVHPYEETVIDIYPIYEIGIKKSPAREG